MFDGRYLEKNQKLIKAIIDFYGSKFFYYKKILDLGAGHADLSSVLHRLAADVTCVDARQEHLKIISKKYQNIKVIKADLDRPWAFQNKKFDMILSIDIINHLKDYETHIRDICHTTTHLILETAVCDSPDPNKSVSLTENKNIYDLSINGVSSYPTAAAIERVLISAGMNFRRLDYEKLNYTNHRYDWTPENNDVCYPQNRRLYFAIKNSSPLQFKKENNIIDSQPITKNIPVIPNIVKGNNRPPSRQLVPPPLSPIVPSVSGPPPKMAFINNFEPTPFGAQHTNKTKIKVFIVTYNSNNDLRLNLDSLFKSDLSNYNWEITIINNHSNFLMDASFASRGVKVIHNQARPDWSTGHLSRSWNQAIVHGFKNLLSPDTDILVTAQVDSLFDQNCFKNLIEWHKKYSLIADGIGDNLVSYLPDAIKKIGLWDERLCNIGYQEADYFLRALIYNKQYSSINDEAHGRRLNPLPSHLVSRTKHKHWFSEDHKKSSVWHDLSNKFFAHKWGDNTPAWNWTPQLLDNPPQHSLIDNYIYYPYFEKDIEDLQQKKYFWVPPTTPFR